MKQLALALMLCLASGAFSGRARAEPPPPPAVPARAEPVHDYRNVSDWLLLAAGAAIGFVAHEAGHLTFDLAVGNDPEFKPVSLGPFPFFAITPTLPTSDNSRYTMAMMGFLVEAAYTEGIFARNPELVRKHRPLLEGMLAFHLVLDFGYAFTGFLGVGPAESDVNTMANASGMPPWAVGIMLCTPLVFDVLRYIRPDTRRWSMWVGMGSRVPMFGAALVL